mmetsp:Transcript_19848/g.51606  ORF Transcript_19848/g.51606 Transcript_19848/m.51606 type:complete len:224 (-) Transcript_19848:1884-2555(-)
MDDGPSWRLLLAGLCCWHGAAPCELQHQLQVLEADAGDLPLLGGVPVPSLPQVCQYMLHHKAREVAQLQAPIRWPAAAHQRAAHPGQGSPSQQGGGNEGIEEAHECYGLWVLLVARLNLVQLCHQVQPGHARQHGPSRCHCRALHQALQQMHPTGVLETVGEGGQDFIEGGFHRVGHRVAHELEHGLREGETAQHRAELPLQTLQERPHLSCSPLLNDLPEER